MILIIMGLIFAGVIATKYGALSVYNLRIGKHYKDWRIQKEDLKPGDHIYMPAISGQGTKSSTNSTLFYHHAVYLDNDEVSDFGAVNSTHPVIRPLDKFLEDRPQALLYRREYTTEFLLAPEKTVQSVRKLCRAIEETEFSFMQKYDRLWNNCEHYATKVKIDKRWSDQVERAKFWNASFADKRFQKRQD